MYTCLLEYDLEDERVKETMVKWAKKFGHGVDLDDWIKMWKESYKMLKPANLRENILKMFYRWHYTPVRLAKISEGNSWKCKKNAGTYYHMLLKKLWYTAELDTLSEALREQPRDYVKQSCELIYSWAQKKTGV